VHVTCPSQLVTGAHALQCEPPFASATTKYPGSHTGQYESLDVVQLTGLTAQWSTGEHGWQLDCTPESNT
jgi:hypothetical protein